MKHKKIVATLSLLVLLINLLCGCYHVNNVPDFKNLVSDDSSDQTNKRPVALSQPADLGSPFCIQATPNAETYGYGEEIEITVEFKFNMLSLGMNDFMSVSQNSVDCSLILEESPNYEIVGENTVTFKDVDRYYYECSNKNHHSFGNPLVATFKIKIYEADYDMYKIYFSFLATNNNFDEEYWKNYPLQEEIDADRELVYTDSSPIYYIADSQGIIMSSLPVHTSKVDYLKIYNRSFNLNDTTRELIQKSFEREKLNGIDDEALIERYLDMLFVDGAVCYCTDSENKKIPWYLRETFTKKEESYTSYTYISKNVRFRVYIPLTQEFSETQQSLSNVDYKASYHEQQCQRIRALLEYALENGVISQDEYNTEINRLKTEEIFVISCSDIESFGVVSSTDDDSYYNYVLDFRVDWGKTYPTFWEWLVQSIKEMLSKIF